MRENDVDDGGYTSRVMRALRLLGVESVVYQFSGAGDSGDFECEDVRWRDRREGGGAAAPIDLARVPFEVQRDGAGEAHVVSLMDAVEAIAQDAAPDGWEDGEGGYGRVTVSPFDADWPLECEYDEHEAEPDDDEAEEWSDDGDDPAIDLGEPALDRLRFPAPADGARPGVARGFDLLDDGEGDAATPTAPRGP